MKITLNEQDLIVQKVTDLSSFLPSKSSGENSRSVRSGIISIINSKESGKRITLSKELMDVLNWPKVLQFAFKDNEIAISESLPENDHNFHVKEYGAKGVIYSSSLVEEITDIFHLDYSDKVSITLRQVKYVTIDDKMIAIITTN